MKASMEVVSPDETLLRDGDWEVRFRIEPSCFNPMREVVRIDVSRGGEIVAGPTFDPEQFGEAVGRLIGGRWL